MLIRDTAYEYAFSYSAQHLDMFHLEIKHSKLIIYKGFVVIYQIIYKTVLI